MSGRDPRPPAPPDAPRSTVGGSRSPQPNVLAPGRLDRSWRFWAIIVATGVCGGLGGGLLMRLLHLIQHLAWSYSSGGFLDAVERTSPAHRVAATFAAGVLVSIGLVALRFRKGGHAQEISVAIWFKAGAAPLVKTLARAALSIAVVGLGAAVGREGALKQTGAALAYRFACWGGLDRPARRLVTACGAGAGLAAAYDLPLGGGLFALEVLLGTLELPFAIPAITCSIIGTLTSWLLLPQAPTYQTPVYHLRLEQIAWAAILGPLAGLLAIPYIRLIAWARTEHPRGPLATILACVLVLTGLGVASVWAPQLLGNGRDLVQGAVTGALPPVWFVAVLLLLRPLATALCLKCGAPGGLFTPTLTFGALLGDVLGRLWSRVAPAVAPLQGGYAVIAAGAFLAACTSAPLSAIVIMIELGRRIDVLIAPMALAAMGAALTARLAGLPSIYSATVERRAARAGRPADGASRWISGDYTVASAAEKLAGALALLVRARGPFYVIDERGRPRGRLDPGRIDRYLDSGEGLSLTTAGDVAEPVQAVRPDAPDHARAPGAPVVDPDSGVLIGVVRAPPDPAGGPARD